MLYLSLFYLKKDIKEQKENLKVVNGILVVPRNA